ncbi:hypothetical protein A2783_02645 [Microgenomates group bacterium RIFCSPHIGHO2_01_FULL_45_11]|nr:MAG: hypothetical protein A2783_02645 [Microgenomates group bacterium RIFCSPHIGHO2_01_FULL_45_11]
MKKIKKQLSVAEYFDRRAPTYGSWFKQSLGNRTVDNLEKEAVLRLLMPPSGKKKLTILEIGVGRGRIARYLLNNLPIESYMGVDISRRMIRTLKKEKIKGLKLIWYKGERLPLKRRMDSVISIRQIKYNQNLANQLLLMKKNLIKNGILIIEFPSCYSVSGIRNLFIKSSGVLVDPFRLKKAVKELGFTAIIMEPLRYLPDNVYALTNGKTMLTVVLILEKWLRKILPYWLAKSILLKARLS